MANAVPVVLPAHGTFPEYVEETGGGVLHEPEHPQSLAQKLAELIRDPSRADAMGLASQQVIRERYTARQMAQEHFGLYERVARQEPRATVAAR